MQPFSVESTPSCRCTKRGVGSTSAAECPGRVGLWVIGVSLSKSTLYLRPHSTAMASRTYFSRSALLLVLLGTFLKGFSVVNGNPTITKNRAVVNEGDEIVIKCEADAPLKTGLAEQISIVKRQTPQDAEMVITTDFLIVHKSYKDRATVKPISNPEGYAIGYEMTIAEATPHDTGEYGCRFSRSGEIVNTAWDTVIVRQQLQKLEMFAVAENGTEFLLEDGQAYQLTKAENYRLKCLATGSNPSATMTIFLGDQAVTSQLFERTEELGGLPAEGPGLGLTLYDTTLLSKDIFEVLVPQTIRCEATVEGSEGSKSVTIMTLFEHAPDIKCFETVAGENNQDVKLTCNVTATPKVKEIHWAVQFQSGLNETIVSGQEYYISSVAHKNNVTTTTLEIERVFKQHFKRTYLVVATNDKGTTQEAAILTEDPNMGKATSTASILTGSLLLIAFTAIFGKL